MSEHTPTPVPPPTHRKPRRWPWFVAVTLAFGLGLGIGLSSTDESFTADGQDVATTEPSETAEPAAEKPAPKPKPEPEPEPEPTNDGPMVFALGEAGSYSEDGVDIGSITAESFETSTEAPDEYSEPPVNGQYLTVAVVATALDGQLYDVNPFDFYVRDDDGNRWDQTSGNAFYAAGDNDLSAVTLNGGETVRGTISFDVPPEATELVYAPGLRALGVWALVTS